MTSQKSQNHKSPDRVPVPRELWTPTPVRGAHGFVVVGPRGMLPGTFSETRETAMLRAEAVVVLSRRGLRAADVRVGAAVLVRPRGAKTWPLSAARIAALNQRIYHHPEGLGRMASQSSEKSRRAAARTTTARR